MEPKAAEGVSATSEATWRGHGLAPIGVEPSAEPSVHYCKHEKTVSVTVAGKSDMRECVACHRQFSGRELAAEQVPPPAASPESLIRICEQSGLPVEECDKCDFHYPSDAYPSSPEPIIAPMEVRLVTPTLYQDPNNPDCWSHSPFIPVTEQAPVDGGTEYDCSFTESGEHAPSLMGDCIYCGNKGRPHKMRPAASPVDTRPDPRVEEIRGRWQMATQGPWEVEREPNYGNVYVKEEKGNRGRVCRLWDGRTATEENAVAIAAAPDDIRYLLSELDRLKGER